MNNDRKIAGLIRGDSAPATSISHVPKMRHRTSMHRQVAQPSTSKPRPPKPPQPIPSVQPNPQVYQNDVYHSDFEPDA